MRKGVWVKLLSIIFTLSFFILVKLGNDIEMIWMSAGSPLLVPIKDISNCLPILISDSDKVTLLIKGIDFDKVGREL
jgi:hypothetical protein